MIDILNHKHILLCGDNRNSLCILRELWEQGISPIVIMESGSQIPLLKNSKYPCEILYVNGFKEAIDKVLTYSDKDNPPFIYLTDDNHLQLLDDNYDILKDNFYFFNAGKKGRITYFYQRKSNVS